MVGLKKLPVIYTLPLASVQTLLPPSAPMPPAEFAHKQFWAFIELFVVIISAAKNIITFFILLCF
jgi:hypothetical protein